MKKIKILTIILLIVLVTMVAFFGVYVPVQNRMENKVKDYDYAMDLEGGRNIRLSVDKTTDTVIKDADGNEVTDADDLSDEELAEKGYTKEETPANSEDVLNEENYKKSKEIIEKRLKALGHVTTLEGKAKEADLIAQKFRILSYNLGRVQNMLSSPSLSKDMREFLENKIFEYMAQITAIRDKIGSNIKEILELEKKNSLLKSEFEYKEKLFTVEKQLYGGKGKELWEHEEQEKLKFYS